MQNSRFVLCDDRHAPAILAIFNEAIVTSTALYDYVPRELPAVLEWFQAKRKGNYPVIGVESLDGTLMGFASYGPFRNFPAYKYTVEHSVYIEKSFRRQGLARKLMIELIESAKRQGYHMMIGVIDSSNQASIALHQKLGFTPCGRIIHAGFKFNRWLDVDFHQLILPTPEHPTDG
jgi:phosphinothricin acetyltransferase